MKGSAVIPPTDQRVPRHTKWTFNARIAECTRADISRVASAGYVAIVQRLAELEREWDIERTLEANAASVALIGLALGVFVNAWWFLLPAIVAAFLLQHSLQGWCPPLPVFRRFGVRTAREIHEEMLALRILRNDFPRTTDPDVAFDAARFDREDAQ
jgi:hypothetical protein